MLLLVKIFKFSYHSKIKPCEGQLCQCSIIIQVLQSVEEKFNSTKIFIALRILLMVFCKLNHSELKVIRKQTCILFSSFLKKENLKQKNKRERERERKQKLAQQVHYQPPTQAFLGELVFHGEGCITSSPKNACVGGQYITTLLNKVLYLLK